jgi:hypothetical protein
MDPARKNVLAPTAARRLFDQDAPREVVQPKAAIATNIGHVADGPDADIDVLIDIILIFQTFLKDLLL